MPIQVNPLILHQLFYEMLNDLEYTQDSLYNALYNDELSRLMRSHHQRKRMEYKKRLLDLIRQIQ